MNYEGILMKYRVHHTFCPPELCSCHDFFQLQLHFNLQLFKRVIPKMYKSIN